MISLLIVLLLYPLRVVSFDYDEFRQTHLQEIKHLILEQLGLDNVPNISQNVRDALLRRQDVQEEIHRLSTPVDAPKSTKSTEIIPAADCARRLCAFNRTIIERIDIEQIRSVYLHVYKPESQPESSAAGSGEAPAPEDVIMSISDDTKTIVAAQLVDGDDYGWIRVRIPKEVVARETNASLVRLLVSHNECIMDQCPGSRCPYLTVTHEKKSSRRRRRRSVGRKNCRSRDRNPKCCRMPLVVTVKDLGWSNWVLKPETFEAFYCTGECPRLYKASSGHALVTSMLKGKVYRKAKPCCVPTSLASVSFVHFTKEGLVTKTKFENLSVNSCGCS
ncbi:inhibin beta C chain-like [Oscarella lobularis]|uniref:inhibin beta C chain-like n=1 Tax=Oscarella lobularis TaxID=121494 RepID=UPI0033132D10